MIIMPSNNTGRVVKDLFKRYPDKTGQLFSPEGWRPPQHQYALDNGAFKRFDEKKYFKMLDSSKSYSKPLWAVAPDVVGCHDRTVALWNYYLPRLKEYEYPLAFVAQDGCNPEDVPDCFCVFVGGYDPWKMDNFHRFQGIREWTHVGRVNSVGRLETCERAEVDSIDGTGWMHARDSKFYGLMEYFNGKQQRGIFDAV